ncbi:MAG: hypothetical protein Q9162_004690 [Coniocarpon cinnabarinum]
MDILLQKVTQQAMNYAIRSGIMITSSYALNQCSRLVKTGKSEERDDLNRLQHRLDTKIRIIAPAIDMIELIAARGNTSLESAVSLTKSIRWSIQSLGIRLSKAAAEEEHARRGITKSKAAEQLAIEIRAIIKDIKGLLERIEDAVPLINLAITTSGVSLSTNLPPTVSPSRLLQASTFLSAGDSQFGIASGRPTQIGPRFTTSVYMLFLGHANQAVDEDRLEKVVWKEVMHKAQMKLVRVPLHQLSQFPFSKPTSQSYFSNDDPAEQQADSTQIPSDAPASEFAYQLTMIEDLDDDRVHTFEDDEAQPDAIDDVKTAGIRTHIPIHQIAKIFYADTGKILNLGSEGEMNNPILLLRRDINAPPPRRMMEHDDATFEDANEHDADVDGSTNTPPSQRWKKPDSFSHSLTGRESDQVTCAWALPSGLDPEWIALEVFKEGSGSDDESDTESGEPPSSPTQSKTASKTMPSSLSSAFSNLQLGSSPQQSVTNARDSSVAGPADSKHLNQFFLNASGPVITSLSLLEMLIRLTSLQQFQQTSHLAITDELLNFFLSEGSTTGAASGDTEARKRIRMEARQHVGFDPYDESPVKRRGEAYQRYSGHDEHDDARLGYSLSSSGPPSPVIYQSRERSSPPARSSPASSFRHSFGSRSAPPIPGSRVESEPPMPTTPSNSDQSRKEASGGDRTQSAQRSSMSSPLARHKPMTSAQMTSSPDV